MTQREEFEKWFNRDFHPDKTGPYVKDQLWFAWQAAKATLAVPDFTLPDRMDYELHGDTVINNPFVDGYNQALSDVISMNEEYANSTGSDGWIPVSERLPDDDDLVLVYDSEGTHGYIYTLRVYREFFDKFKCVTHWMPLPAAPEQK